MRIIAGDWRGRRLTAPPGETTRPTSDRTRETLFSMLNSRLGTFQDLQVLDLFAGSGALGLEALSRGASHCLFVEQDREAVEAMRRTFAHFQLGGRGEIRAQSVLTLGVAKQPFDLILMDPPYGSGAGAVALDKLGRLGWIGPASWIAIETSRDETIDVKGFTTEAMRGVGKAMLHILRMDDTPPSAE